jgi:hypothetical protein
MYAHATATSRQARDSFIEPRALKYRALSGVSEGLKE